MAHHADRHATGPSPHPPLLPSPLALVALAAVVEVAAQAGATVDRWRHRPPVDPLALALELADGRTRWPPAATAILIATTIACALIAASVALTRLRRPATSADRAARMLAAGCGEHPVSLANANQTAQRFGVDQPGSTWEDMQYDICAPRKGKSSSRAIPTLLAAPDPTNPRTPS